MKWFVKAATQKLISCLPNSESINYVFQRHVSRTLLASLPQFLEKAVQAAGHLSHALKLTSGCELSGLSLYEFGAGWDLIIPLTYYALGINRQTLVDIRPGLRLE